MNKFEMGFELIVVCEWGFKRSPEKRIIVRERGEEHAQEEAGGANDHEGCE